VENATVSFAGPDRKRKIISLFRRVTALTEQGKVACRSIFTSVDRRDPSGDQFNLRMRD